MGCHIIVGAFMPECMSWGGGGDGQKWMINRNFVVNSVIDDDV